MTLSAPNSSRQSELITVLALCALALAAFRDLLMRGLGGNADAAVFAVAPLPGSFVLLVAGWYAWRRFRPSALPESIPSSSTSVVPVALLLAGSLLVFAWARAIGDTSLQFPALALLLVGFARAWGGAPLARRACLPALVLLLGMSIPRPLEDEIVWALQRTTAIGANAVLNAIGHEAKVAGVILRDGTHTFHVIDSCCGLTGILILIVIAVIVRELFELGKSRSAMLFTVTIAIGWFVNIVRVAYVASRPNPEKLAGAGGDHTLQGVLVLAVGSAAVYAAGLLLEDREAGSAPGPAATAEAPPVRPKVRFFPSLIAVGAILLVSVFVTDSPLAADQDPLTRPIELQRRGDRWKAEKAPPEPYFNGLFVDQFHQRFTLAGDSGRLNFVDVFVGQGRGQGDFSTRLFSSKRFYPGPDWNLVSRERRMLWSLGDEVDTSISAPNNQREHAISYVWTTGEHGLLVDSLRSLIGLDRLQSEDALAEPVLVRVTAYAPWGSELRIDGAEKRINVFIRDHLEAFAALR